MRENPVLRTSRARADRAGRVLVEKGFVLVEKGFVLVEKGFVLVDVLFSFVWVCFWGAYVRTGK
ncbi:hypothetical protein CCP3SC1_70053 [Gammaproteobacteria bacterium]